MTRLRQLHAPSMESAQFASYVQSNDAQAATMQRAIALAQTGDPKVIDEVGLVGVLASESAKTAAAMGFRACG